MEEQKVYLSKRKGFCPKYKNLELDANGGTKETLWVCFDTPNEWATVDNVIEQLIEFRDNRYSDRVHKSDDVEFIPGSSILIHKGNG